MKKWVALLLCGVLLAGSACVVSCGGKEGISVSVDFSQKTGTEVQNIKKIDMFSPTWEFCGSAAGLTNGESMETLAYLDDLQAERFRIDLMMGNGGIGAPIGADGKNGTSDGEMNAVLEVAQKLQENDVSPMFVMCNIPEYAQIDGEDKQLPDMTRWYEVLYNAVKYLKNKGITNVTYETWNEPDLGTTFWGGTMAEMIETSIVSAKAVRDADKYATVSALGLCWPLDFISKKQTVDGETLTHWDRFWKRSVEEGAMPDALSWHYYGQPGGMMEGNLDETTNFSYWLTQIRAAFKETTEGMGELDAPVDLSTVQQLITEYHAASSLDSHEDTIGNISKMYDSIGYALDATDLTKVYWACYVSELFGVIDKYSYQKNAGYNVLWSYARLPLDRVECDISDPELGYYCGADGSRAGLILYNKGTQAKNVAVNLSGIPFDAEDLTVYVIDNENLATATDIMTPYASLQKQNVSEDDLKNISITLGANEGCYIEINDESGKSEIEEKKSVGEILKKEYYYYDRGDKLPYADIHNNSLTAIVGMADSMSGQSAVSMIVDTGKDCSGFIVQYSGWGQFVRTAESALGMKVDYQTGNGYTKSVYYALDGYDCDLILPFGTKANANEIVAVEGLEGSFRVDLAAKAPADWNGIVSITYLIKDAGLGATEKFTIVPDAR